VSESQARNKSRTYRAKSTSDNETTNVELSRSATQNFIHGSLGATSAVHGTSNGASGIGANNLNLEREGRGSVCHRLKTVYRIVAGSRSSSPDCLSPSHDSWVLRWLLWLARKVTLTLYHIAKSVQHCSNILFAFPVAF